MLWGNSSFEHSWQPIDLSKICITFQIRWPRPNIPVSRLFGFRLQSLYSTFNILTYCMYVCIQFYIIYTDYPPKMITGLLASITFKIMNQSKYALRFWNYNWLCAFNRKAHPIWFSSHEEIGIRFIFVMSAFHPSFVHNLLKPFNKRVELRSLSLLAVKFGWKGLMTYFTHTKSYSFVTTEPNRIVDGVFGKIQTINYSFKILKHI